MSTYKQAGVDIDAGEQFAAMIKERVTAAWPDAGKEIGGFAGGGPIPQGATEVKASTDGTGTKMIVAAMVGEFGGIGQDVVAMAAVDTYVAGNTPWYLLDTIAVDHLNPKLHIQIIESVIRGCRLANCRLINGETEELPGTFKHPWMVNLNATCIGFLDPRLTFVPVEPDQLVYGWPSGGVGSNGFSLVRKVFGLNKGVRKARKRLEEYTPGLIAPLESHLLEPTPIWIQQIEAQRERGVRFAGHAHITGGGMVGNIPRILPANCKVVIHRLTWLRPGIFPLIQHLGKVPEEEMERTFNQGIMVASIVSGQGEELVDPQARCIGQVEKRQGDEPQVQFVGKYIDE